MGIYPFFFFLRWRKQNEFKLLHKQILFRRIVSTDKYNLKFKFKAFTYHECCWECWMLWLWISPSKLSEESLNDVFKETLSLVSLLMYIPYPTLLQKRSILDVWQGSEYASATLNLWNWSVFKFTDLKFLNNLESFKFNKDY